LILADTSVWIDHFRKGDAAFAARLEAGEILSHPFVIGELAMGNLNSREALLRELGRLPGAAVARPEEILALISREKLHGLGLGYVDAALLAATRLSPDARLWTRDRRLAQVAGRMNLAFAAA
jgi:predicted nucleic acid-binding protein